MNRFWLLSLVCVLSFSFLYSHEGHKEHKLEDTFQEHVHQEASPAPIQQGRPQNWLQWAGGFHFIFLHFPIALIIMTVISELIFSWNSRPIYDHAARFMLVAAAILAIPTALLGLMLRYSTTYEGLFADFIWWHMWAGITTAVFAIFVAFLRENYGRTQLYFIALFLLFLLVNLTGFLGGAMTFGPYQMYPPQ